MNVISLETKRLEKNLNGESDLALVKYYSQLTLVQLVNETQDIIGRIIRDGVTEESSNESIAIFKEIESRLVKTNDSFAAPLKGMLIQLKENLYKLSKL
jgi:hypothetical protein